MKAPVSSFGSYYSCRLSTGWRTPPGVPLTKLLSSPPPPTEVKTMVSLSAATRNGAKLFFRIFFTNEHGAKMKPISRRDTEMLCHVLVSVNLFIKKFIILFFEHFPMNNFRC
jgi:hypothetical protein